MCLIYFCVDTKNPLSALGYEHITAAREIQPPDLDLVRLIEKITPGGAEGDCMTYHSHYYLCLINIYIYYAVIDALIVGMGMLIEKKGKFSHRVSALLFRKSVFLVYLCIFYLTLVLDLLGDRCWFLC